jgi:hypothetical protein
MLKLKQLVENQEAKGSRYWQYKDFVGLVASWRPVMPLDAFSLNS